MMQRRRRFFSILSLLIMLPAVAWLTARTLGGPQTLAVPKVVGQKIEKAKALLAEQGFAVEKIVRKSRLPAGTVVKQKPTASQVMRYGATVVVVVSASRAELAAIAKAREEIVPRLVGGTLVGARFKARRNHFKVVVDPEFGKASNGIVASQGLGPGSKFGPRHVITVRLVRNPGTGSPYAFPSYDPSYYSVDETFITRGNTGAKRVAITLDDGGNADMRILDLFKGYGIRGTAFLLGSSVKENPKLVARLDRDGWEVANHTYNHYNLTNLGEYSMVRELQRTQELISRITGKQYPYLRPPMGAMNSSVKRIAADNGYKLVNWSNTLSDTGILSGRGHADFALRGLGNGSIILGHFGGNNTYDALRILIPELQRRGYEIVTLSKLLK